MYSNLIPSDYANNQRSIRQVDMDDNLRIWRTFKMGKLFDLIMLDTRNYDRSITSLNWNDDYVAELKDDAGRSLMGSLQENWFYKQLSASHERGAIWRVIGNQIIFSRTNESAVFSEAINVDQWDVSILLVGSFESRLTLLGLHGKPQPHSSPLVHQRDP
jgi:phosphodiesterase/alkaline phosphatase D-like protein